MELVAKDKFVWFPTQTARAQLFRKKLLRSERTMCVCLVENAGNTGDETAWEEAWLPVNTEYQSIENLRS